MNKKPSLPKGTRDFGPDVMVKRQFIVDKISEVFKKYGFQPLETPAMENLSVLQGKYGEEGDRLLYKILNSGDFLKNTEEQDFDNLSDLTGKISEKGLRYDLTVPFARYVASQRHELVFPFKRYQIQPVWRADRPQKGRYREFYQCDADVVGTNSLICEAEIVLMINEVFQNLNIKNFSIRINHRAIIEGICEKIGASDKVSEFSVAIDKLDKIGWEGVENEFEKRGFSSEQISNINDLLKSSDVTSLRNSLNNTAGERGVDDIDEFQTILKSFGNQDYHFEFDPTLARGLAYYTGMIFEVSIQDSGIGSVSGGGRYDDLTGIFGLNDVPGVGFSFGIDRLFDAMENLNLFPSATMAGIRVLIAHFDKTGLSYGISLLSKLRNAGIAGEIYPDESKIKKQMSYADRKNIPYVMVIGTKEIETGIITLKDMNTGKESSMDIDEIIRTLSAIK